MDPRAARFDPPTEPHVQPADPSPIPESLGEGPTLARARPGEAEAALLGVPFDGTSGRRPMQRHAPGLLRAQLFGGEGVPVHDRGDVRTPPRDTDVLDERLQGAVRDAARTGALPALLGGEHTVSLPAVRALEPASIVSLDAHTDLWAETNGKQVAHGTWLYHAREALSCEVALPLTRTLRGTAEEEVQREGTHLELPNALPEPVYLSIDVDVFDPEHAPAVVFPEHGGPAPGEVLDTVREVASRFKLCGVDVVEVNANRTGPTARLAARALAEAVAAGVEE